MTSPALSLSEVNNLEVVVISDFTQLHFAIECAALRYGEAAELERAALAMFYEGIDAGYTSEALNDLRTHADLAEQLRREAYRSLDLAKAALLAVQN